MTEFSQGTIIQYIKSPNHPGVQCGGVVINARCDIAQEKVKRISMLSCMTLEKWIFNVFYGMLLEKMQEDESKSLEEFCKRHSLQSDILIEFGADKARIAIEKCGAKKSEQTKIIERIKTIKSLEALKVNPPPDQDKKEQIIKKGKELTSKLTELHNGKLSKYCFVPKKSYLKGSEVLNDGIVIDLHDIVQISYNQYLDICNGRIDCKHMTPEEIEKARNFFFLDEYDFVFAQKDFYIRSPWIEHVLQQFALAFSRIGVENPGKSEINDYFEAWKKED